MTITPETAPDTNWNPRFLAYAHAQGERDPKAMIALDRERWPGGVLTGFTLWNREQWNEFFLESEGAVPSDNDRAIAVHKHLFAYDVWLSARFAAPVAV